MNLFGIFKSFTIVSNAAPNPVPETTDKLMPYSEKLNVADRQPPQMFTNPVCLVAQAPKFCTVASNVFSNLARKFFHIQFLAPTIFSSLPDFWKICAHVKCCSSSLTEMSYSEASFDFRRKSWDTGDDHFLQYDAMLSLNVHSHSTML